MNTNKKMYHVISNTTQTLFGIEMISGEKVVDVFTSIDAAQKAADQFNRLRLSPLHFHDVMRDILVELYFFVKTEHGGASDISALAAQPAEQECVTALSAKRQIKYGTLAV